MNPASAVSITAATSTVFGSGTSVGSLSQKAILSMAPANRVKVLPLSSLILSGPLPSPT